MIKLFSDSVELLIILHLSVVQPASHPYEVAFLADKDGYEQNENRETLTQTIPRQMANRFHRFADELSNIQT